MTRIGIASLLLLLAGAAQAQQPPAPAGAAQPAGNNGKADAPTPGTSDSANQQTYKMKDGGMYQPPAQRPVSPAQDVSVYGRT